MDAVPSTHPPEVDERRDRPPSSSSYLVPTLLALLFAAVVLLLVFMLMPRTMRYPASQLLHTPLAMAVADFNAQAASDPVGQREPPLTEAELVTVIQTELPSLRSSNQVKGVFADIARTRTLPPGARLSARSEWKLKNGTRYTVWWVQLNVTIGQSYWALRIRENNAPAAKPASEPSLTHTGAAWRTYRN